MPPLRAALLILLLLLHPPAALADVTIFIYHRFGDDRYPSTNVRIEQFREQMAYLRDHGYRVIPLAELVAALKEQRPLPKRAAVITIDDGYRSVHAQGWPVLRSHGYPFTVFLYTRATEEGWGDHLTWDQVREMKAAGVDFQDHSYSHHRLANRPAGLKEDEYRAWIRADLRKSAELLARRLGEKPRFLAVPYGEYNRIVLEEAAASGYEAVFSQDAGSVGSDTDLLLVPREPILGREWSTLEHFKTVLEREDLPFVDMSPGLEPLADPQPKRFAVRLLHPERYLPATLGIYVSELGWRPATLEGDLLYIDSRAVLTRRLNRVAVTGRDRQTGRTAIRFWLLLQP